MCMYSLAIPTSPQSKRPAEFTPIVVVGRCSNDGDSYLYPNRSRAKLALGHNSLVVVSRMA
jgi:hypothetical protein